MKKQYNIYLEEYQIKFLRENEDININGFVRREIDKMIKKRRSQK